MNIRLIFLLICVAFLTVVASNTAAADASGIDNLTSVTSAVTSDIIDDQGPVWSPEGDAILFRRDGEIYRIFSNGSGETRLTDTGGNVGVYSWSSDGSKILYSLVIEPEFDSDIWVMNANGSLAIRLTGPTEEGVEPAKKDFGTWSPTGSKIAYSSVFGIHSSDLILMNPDGSGEQSLTNPLSGNYFYSVAWSPDASRIAFESDSIDMGRYIGVINSDGSNLTVAAYGYLAPQTRSWQSEVWSPDGSKILYYAYENDQIGTMDIYAINVDGSGKTQLTTDEADDHHPRFSPDGSRIVFVSDRTGNADIWLMDADGNNKVQLTTSPASDTCPVWSPDGTKIAFCSDRNGNNDIWVIELSGDTFQEFPSPRVTGFTVDPSDEVPEDGTAAISVTVRNDGDKSGEGYIVVSFPNDEEILSVKGTGSGYNKLYPEGSSIPGKDGPIPFSDYPLA